MSHPDAVTYSDSDVAHEACILAELRLSQAASAIGQRDKAQAHWREFVRLIGERTARQVAQMEREQGLV